MRERKLSADGKGGLWAFMAVPLAAACLLLATCDIFKAGLGAKIDVSAPTVSETAVTNGSYVRGTITLSGGAKDDVGVQSVTVLVSTGSTQLGSVPATVKNGQWTAVIDTAALAPNQEIQANLDIKVVDGSGKESDQKLVLYFDNVAPTITAMTPSTATLENTSNYLSETVSFSGSVKDGFGAASLTFTAGGVQFPLAAGSTPATWKVIIDTAGNNPATGGPWFVAGANGVTVADVSRPGSLRVPLTITATDYAGNVSTAVSTHFFVDQAAAAPAISLQNIDATIAYPNTTPQVKSNILAPGSTVSARITSPTGIDAGSVAMTLTPPSASGLPALVFSTGNHNLSVQTITQDGQALLAAIVSATLPTSLAQLPLGEYQFGMVAADDPSLKLNNTKDTRTISGVSLMINNGTPTVAALSPANGAFVRGFSASGTIDDGIGPSEVQVSIDGGGASAATLTQGTPTHSTWSFTYSGAPALAEGLHTAAITGYDTAGSHNSPPLNLQFTIDTTPPTASVQSVAPAVASTTLTPVAFADAIDASVPGGTEDVVNGVARFKGTAADSAALQSVAWAIYHVTSTSTWSTDPAAVASGSFPSQSMSLWSLDVDTTDTAKYADGDYYVLQVVATDQAGNASAPVQRTFRVLQASDAPNCQFLNMDSTAATRAQAKLNLLNTKIELDATVTDDDRVDPSSLRILIDPVDGGGNPSPTGTPAASDSISGTVNSVTGAVTFSYSFASTHTGTGTALAEGRHFFYLKASDDANWKDGKASTPTTIGPVWFAIDTAQPQISFNQTGGIYVSSTQALSGTVYSANALDEGSPFTLTPQGGSASAPALSPAASSAGVSHSWTYTLDVSGDPDGPLAVTAAAKDEFGLSTTQSITVTVDKTPPVIAVYNSTQIFNENVATLTGTAMDVTSGVASMSATVKNSLDVDVSSQATLTLNAVAGTPNVTGNWGLDLSQLPTGQYSITLTATDKAGNARTYALAGQTTIDKDLPVVAIAAPLDGHTYNASFVPPANWSGTASDSFLSGVQIKLDSGSYTAAATPASWTYAANWAALSEGQHTLTVAASDLGGHVTTRTATFVKDTIPPSVLYSNINTAGGSVLSETVTALTGAVSEATTSIASVVVVFDRGTGSEQRYDLSGSLSPNSTFFSWSQNISGLAEGAHTVVVETADAAGNSNSAATPIAFMIDRLPPTIGAGSIGSTYKNAPFIVSGTSADSASGVQAVRASIDGGGAVAATDTSGAGNWSTWSYNLASAFAALAEGSHTLTFTAADGAAHQTTVNVGFIKDTVSPTSSLGNIGGSGGSVLNETVTALTGTLADATSGLASTSIAIDSGSSQSLNVTAGASSQSWSWDIGGLAEGSHTVELSASDRAGNLFAGGQVSFVIDRLPPAISVNAIGNQYRKSAFALTGTSSDAASGVQTVTVSVDGGTAVSATDGSAGHDWSSWSYDLAASFAALSEGPHTLVFTSKDRAGHQASASVGFVKDTLAPTQSFGNIVAGSNSLLNETVNALNGSLADPTSGIASMQISIDGAAAASLGTPGGATNQGWTWDISTLADGTHSVEILASDQAGNAYDSGAVSFRVDRQWPTLAIATPTGSTVYSAGFGAPAGTANGTASHVFLASVQYKVDSGSYAPATGTSAWTAAVGWAGLSEGAHTLTAQATDAAGHVTTASATFTKDSLPPAVSYTNLATSLPWSIYEQAGAKIAGSLSDSSGVATAQYEVEQYVGGSWAVKQASTSLGDTSNATNFSWSVDLSGYADGHYRLTIRSTDVASPANSLASGPYEFYIDTAAPAASITGIANGAVLSADPGSPAGIGSDANLVALTLQLDSGAPLNILAEAPNWTYPAWSWAGLAEGAHTIALKATDVAGRLTSATVSFTKDTTPPTVSVNTLTAQTGTSSYVIQDASPSLSGTLTDAVGLAGWDYRIERWTDSANPGGTTWTAGTTSAVVRDWAAAPAAASGTTQAWSVDISSAGLNLADGRYRILLHATDGSSPANQSADLVREFRLDRSAPSLAVTAPASQGLYFSAAIAVAGTATEVNGISAVKLKFDSNDFSSGSIQSATPDSSGNWSASMPLTGLASDGQHILYVEAVSYTNKTSVQSVAVNIDRNAPAIAITSVTNGTVVTGNVTISGTANDNTLLQAVQYKYGKNATGWTSMGSGNLYSWSINFPNINSLANTTYATEVDPNNPQNPEPGSDVWLLPIWAQATDAAGNTTQLSTTSSVNNHVFYLLIQPSLDNPSVSVVYPADNAVLGGSVRVYGTALDNTWINGVQYAIDPTGTGSSYGAWQSASISGNLGPSVNWYALLNADGSLNPSTGQQTRTVLVKVQATDAKVPPYTSTVHTSVPQIIHIVFNADVPSFNDLQVQSTSGTQGYASGEMVSGTFAVQAVVKTPVGLGDLKYQDLSPDANAGSVLANPSIVTPPASKTITTGASLITGRTYLIVQAGGTNWAALGAAAGAGVGNTFSYNGDLADLSGGGVVYEADADNLFEYRVSMSVNSTTMFANTTGLYQVNLVATDLTSPNPYMAQTTFTLQIDNYYPTSAISSSPSLVGTAYQIQGTATDVGSGSGTISGIQKAVVYLTNTSDTSILNLKTSGGATSSGTTIAAWDGGTRGSSPSSYIYPYAETAGSAHTYYASIDSLTEAGLSDATPTGNGDGFLESLTLAGNTYNWWAQIDSTKLPDGPVHVHYVVFDAAGNPTHYVQTNAFIANNGPAISSVTLGTDLDGDGGTNGSGEQSTYNASLTGFTARNSRLYFSIATTKGNAPLGYSVKYAGTEYDSGNASSFTISNFASIPDSTLVPAGSFSVGAVYTIQRAGTTDFTLIGAVSNAVGTSFVATGAGTGSGFAYLNRAFTVTVSDSTPGSPQTATLVLNLVVKNTDSVAPTIAVAPFGKTYAPVPSPNIDSNKTLGAVASYSDNLGAAGGHVEYAAASPLGDGRDALSGQVVFHGKAWDDQRIQRITATIAGFNGGSGVGSEFTLASFSGSALVAQSGTAWSFAIDASSQALSLTDGHLLNWSFTWDSSQISSGAATNEAVTFKVYDFGSNSGNSAMAVDVVPYVTSIQRNATLYNTNRSKYGRYPVMEGEAGLAVNGYNLPSSTTADANNWVKLYNDPTAGAADSANVPTMTAVAGSGARTSVTLTLANGQKSGWLRIAVNGIEATNNKNDNGQSYNKQDDGSGIAGTKWTDDLYLSVWNVDRWANSNAFATSSNAQYPAFAVDSSGTLYGSWINYAAATTVYNSINGSTGVAGTAANIFALYDPPEFTDISIDPANNRPTIAYIQNTYGGNGWSAANAGSVNVWTSDINQSTRNQLQQADAGYYGFITDGLWHNQVLWEHYGVKVVRSGNNIHVAWYDDISKSVKYAYFASTQNIALTGGSNAEQGWINIDGSSTTGASDATAPGIGYVTNFASGIARTSSVGQSVSIDVDKSGCPVISYYDNANHVLRVAYANSPTPTGLGNWKVQLAHPTADPLDSYSGADSGDKNGNLTLKINHSTGNAYIVAYRPSKGQEVYMKAPDHGTGDFAFGAVSVLDSSGNVGSWSEISIDTANDRPTMVYENKSMLGTYDGVKLTYWDPGVGSGGDWESMIPPAKNPVSDAKLSIAWNNNYTGVPWQVALGFKSDQFRVMYLQKTN